MEKNCLVSKETLLANRFDNIFNLIMQDGERQGNATVLASKLLSADSEQTLIRFSAYSYPPLPEDYTAEYGPSIMAELGDDEHLEDGKPVAEVLRFRVKRSDFEKAHNTTSERAAQELEIIEELLFACQNGRYQE